MFFVMKLSKLCNLRCTYCYEYDELENKERMPLDKLAYFFESVADFYVARSMRGELRFVLHGGEPMLLPEEYLRAFVGLQRDLLGSRGVPYRNSLQTNLFKVDPRRLDLLEELGIGLGVSLDVFGKQRLTITGQDSQEKVIDNLQLLFETGAIERLSVGLIAVLHRDNILNAERTFEFCDDLGLSFRILPLFSLGEPPERMRHLTVDHPDVVEALKRVADTQLGMEGGGRGITVYPLWNYFLAAVHHLSKRPATTYDPRKGEWAFIVNTNGDTYNHAEAYLPEGRMGNVFTQPLTTIFESEDRKRTIALRMARNEVCEACPYSQSCSRIHVVEALPSERAYDADGNLTCPIARPMIDYFVERISEHEEATELLNQALALPAPEQGPEAVLSDMTS